MESVCDRTDEVGAMSEMERFLGFIAHDWEQTSFEEKVERYRRLAGQEITVGGVWNGLRWEGSDGGFKMPIGTILFPRTHKDRSSAVEQFDLVIPPAWVEECKHIPLSHPVTARGRIPAEHVEKALEMYRASWNQHTRMFLAGFPLLDLKCLQLQTTQSAPADPAFGSTPAQDSTPAGQPSLDRPESYPVNGRQREGSLLQQIFALALLAAGLTPAVWFLILAFRSGLSHFAWNGTLLALSATFLVPGVLLLLRSGSRIVLLVSVLLNAALLTAILTAPIRGQSVADFLSEREEDWLNILPERWINGIFKGRVERAHSMSIDIGALRDKRRSIYVFSHHTIRSGSKWSRYCPYPRILVWGANLYGTEPLSSADLLDLADPRNHGKRIVYCILPADRRLWQKKFDPLKVGVLLGFVFDEEPALDVETKFRRKYPHW